MRFQIIKNQRLAPFIVALLFFSVTLVVYYLTYPGYNTPYDYFVWLADAFIHGRLSLKEAPPRLTELIPFNGNIYVVYPPMPAILLIPFVAIWGVEFKQTLASIVLGSINVSLVYLVMRRLTSSESVRIWMTVLVAFSTIHWYIATIGSSWYLAHICSFLFLNLAIYETLGKKRPFLIGLLVGASYWSRLSTILGLPFFIIMLSDKWLSNSEEPFLKRIRLKPLIQLGSGTAVFVFLNLTYNYLRFGTPLDVAYTMLLTPSAQPWFDRGMFSLYYIPYHLYVILAKPPVFIDKPPYVVPSMQGLSILVTTPAFIYSIFAGIRNRLAFACWSAIIPIALLIFTKAGTGWTQFGYRYAMDFYPFLILLTLRGIGSTLRWHHKLLICLGILTNTWGVLWINKFRWFDWWG
jgi:hypothetical protein